MNQEHALLNYYKAMTAHRQMLIDKVQADGKLLSPQQVAELFSTMPLPQNSIAGLRSRLYGVLIAGLPLPLLITDPGRIIRDALNRIQTKAVGIGGLGVRNG